MSDNRISRWQQVKVYVNKFFGLFWNEKSWKSILFGAAISLIISFVVEDGTFKYWSQTQSGCFAIVSACIWVGIFNSIQSICKERAILKREHRSGLHISAYVFAHMIYQSVICLVQSVVMTIICTICISHFPDEGIIFGPGFIEMFISFFLITYTADVLGLMVSSIVKTPTTAMTVMPFLLIFQLVLSGVLFSLSGSADTVANLTISKWGMQAIGSIGGMESGNMYFSAKSESLGGAYYVFDKAGMNFDGTASHLLSCWGILLLFIVLYAAISIISLEFIDKDKR